MKIEEIILELPEGLKKAKIQHFIENDRKFLYDVYINWLTLCRQMKGLESRTINLPEGLSEGAFCLEMNAERLIGGISGANSSFDCYAFEKNERIQVKACSVIPDLTSFGPNSVWDRLYFLDFYRKGNWDGTFDIYLIEDSFIYNQKVNKLQSFSQQQDQNRRPRFSIWKHIIVANHLSPIKTGNLSV